MVRSAGHSGRDLAWLLCLRPPLLPLLQVTQLDLSREEARGKELCWSIVDKTDGDCTTLEDFCAGPKCRFTTFDPSNDCCPIYTHSQAWRAHAF